MKKVVLTLITASIGILMISSIAVADRFGKGIGEHGQRGKGGGTGMKMILRNADAIDLTEQQQSQLTDMSEAFQLRQIDQKAEIQKAHVRLRSLKRDEQAIEKDVLKAIDEVGQLKIEMHKMSYQHRSAVKKVLTEQQRDKLKSIMKERHSGSFGHGEQKGRGRGMGSR